LALFGEGTITVNPATAITSQNMADQRICDGQNFSAISINATGTGTLSYQWFSNDNPNKTGAVAVGNSTTFTPPSNVVGTKYYYVEVSSTCGPVVTSNFSRATVESITAISAQPSDLDDIKCFGNDFEPLSVEAIGGDLAYQWYAKPDDSNIASNPGVAVPSANASTFLPPLYSDRSQLLLCGRYWFLRNCHLIIIRRTSSQPSIYGN
jgi:hypothetical protein